MKPLTGNSKGEMRCYIDLTALCLHQPLAVVRIPHIGPCMLQNDGGLRKPLHKQKPAVWQQISANIFTHREKKTQHEDDIMICACPKPANGKPGCGPNCLNRQLAIECHPVSTQLAYLQMCGFHLLQAASNAPLCLHMSILMHLLCILNMQHCILLSGLCITRLCLACVCWHQLRHLCLHRTGVRAVTSVPTRCFLGSSTPRSTRSVCSTTYCNTRLFLVCSMPAFTKIDVLWQGHVVPPALLVLHMNVLDNCV